MDGQRTHVMTAEAIRGYLRGRFANANAAYRYAEGRGIPRATLYKVWENSGQVVEASLLALTEFVEDLMDGHVQVEAADRAVNYNREAQSIAIAAAESRAQVQPHPGDEGLSIDRSEVGDEVPEEAAG